MDIYIYNLRLCSLLQQSKSKMSTREKRERGGDSIQNIPLVRVHIVHRSTCTYIHVHYSTMYYNMYKYKYVHTYSYIYTQIYYIFIYVYLCTCACVCACVRAHLYIFRYICARYTCIYIIINIALYLYIIQVSHSRERRETRCAPVSAHINIICSLEPELVLHRLIICTRTSFIVCTCLYALCRGVCCELSVFLLFLSRLS